jgi:hypothetical protein
LKKFTFSLALEWGLFLYIVIGFAASYLLPISEIAKSVLSLPSWLLIPYFFGSFLKIVLQRLRLDYFGGRIEVGVFSLMFGIYSLIIFTFLLDLLGLPFMLVNLYIITLIIALVYLLYKTFRKVGDGFLVNASVLKTYSPIFAFCILVSIIPAMMKASVPGFPYGTIETISIPFEQSQPALRFMEYGYLQHPRIYDYVSLGISSRLFNIDPVSFIWSSPFLMMAIFSFGLFLFAYGISKNKSFSLMVVLIGSFLNMNVFRDAPLLFKANVFFYIFLPFMLYLSYKSISKKDYKAKNVVVALFLISLITVIFVYLIESNIWSVFVPKNLSYPLEWRSHVWIPTIVVATAPTLLVIGLFSKFFIKKNSFLIDNALLLGFIPFFFFAFQNIEAVAFVFFIFAFILLYFLAKNKKTRALLYLFAAFVLGFVLYQHYVDEIGISNPISSIFLPSYSNSTEIISFSSRFSWIFNINLTLTLVVLLIFGITMSIFSRKKGDIFIISVFSLALFLYLFPETFAYRFYREVTVIMAFMIGLGLWRIFTAISGENKKFSNIIFASIIVVLILPSLITPVYTRYHETTMGQSLLSNSEYSTAQWLKQNTPENTIIVSDFETMELVATLSNRMLPIDRNYIVEGLNQNSIQTLWLIKNMFTVNYLNYSIENDGGTQFWNTYSFGKGAIDVVSENVAQSNNVKTIKIIEGNKSVAGIIHKFDSKQNWNNASGLYIDWYGKNTNATWQVCVAASDDLNWFAFNFKDNFSGWKNISAAFNSFSKVGSPNWETVSYIAIRSSDALPNIWSFKDVGLSYTESLNINSDCATYLRKNATSTEQRYCEKTGLSLDNAKVLIILTYRTLQWVKQEGISQTLSTLNGAVDTNSLELFSRVSCLQQLHSENNEIYVFEIK